MTAQLKLGVKVAYSIYCILISLVFIWMVWESPTWVGKGLALLMLLVSLLPFLVSNWLKQVKPNGWGIPTACAMGLVIGLVGVIVFATPTGEPSTSSLVKHGFASGHFTRFAFSNIVPESEQINLGFLLMPFVDPLLTHEQARIARSHTLDIYREMESDRDFNALGSTMGLAYRDLLGLTANTQHYYLYVPQHQQNEGLPVIVFLHGSAGNFKAYTWVWAEFAEANGFAIIAPSYGFGNWDEVGAEQVLHILEDVKTKINVNSDQVYLAGLSNGGLGVSHLAVIAPDTFAGLLFFSPVFSTTHIEGEDFEAGWKNRPIFVLSGALDKRIPISYVNTRVSNMQAQGANVRAITYPTEDHFLFFAKNEEVMADVTMWLTDVASE